MKTNRVNECREEASGAGSFHQACWQSSRVVLTRVRAARNAILAEAWAMLGVQDQLLRLALHEAEALAWRTLYPHLIFPSLATEKVREVAAWDRRQRVVRWQDDRSDC